MTWSYDFGKAFAIWEGNKSKLNFTSFQTKSLSETRVRKSKEFSYNVQEKLECLESILTLPCVKRRNVGKTNNVTST